MGIKTPISGAKRLIRLGDGTQVARALEAVGFGLGLREWAATCWPECQ